MFKTLQFALNYILKLAKRLICLYTREWVWQMCGKAEWVVKS